LSQLEPRGGFAELLLLLLAVLLLIVLVLLLGGNPAVAPALLPAVETVAACISLASEVYAELSEPLLLPLGAGTGDQVPAYGHSRAISFDLKGSWSGGPTWDSRVQLYLR
jgi:hypothetical protein